MQVNWSLELKTWVGKFAGFRILNRWDFGEDFQSKKQELDVETWYHFREDYMIMLPPVTRPLDKDQSGISHIHGFFSFSAFKNTLLFLCRKKKFLISPSTWIEPEIVGPVFWFWFFYHYYPTIYVLNYMWTVSQNQCHYFISKDYIIHNELNSIPLIINQHLH